MGRLPEAVDATETQRSEELVVSLQVYDELNLDCGLNGHQIMNRNILYLVIGALVVATAVFGYQLYQERQKTTGIEINVGERGISIEKK